MCVFAILLFFQMIILHVRNMELKYLNTFLILVVEHTVRPSPVIKKHWLNR